VAESDNQLIQEILAGNRAAFDLLVRQHQAGVYRLAHRMLRNTEDARDVAQEVFLQAYRSLGGFRGQSRLSTWLYRITVNLCLNHLKGSRREAPAEVDAGHSDDRPNALEVLVAEERDRALLSAIDELPPQQRATLILRVQQGLGHREIAEVLDCAEGTAKANYFHAVRALQRRLHERGIAPERS
jgi:RNA polymerase sigma-70 factor (ECF subfamily)